MFVASRDDIMAKGSSRWNVNTSLIGEKSIAPVEVGEA